MYSVTHEERVSAGRRLVISKGHEPWTDKSISELKMMYQKKMPVVDIATTLGRTPSAIWSRLNLLGLSRRQRYTCEDISYLRKFYGLKPLIEIANHLGREIRAVHQKAFKLGLGGRYFGGNHRCAVLSDHEVELVRQLHDEGLSNCVIADKMEVHQATVSHLVNFRCRRDLTFVGRAEPSKSRFDA